MLVAAVGALVLDVGVAVVTTVGSCVEEVFDAVETLEAAVGAPVLDVGFAVVASVGSCVGAAVDAVGR